MQIHSLVADTVSISLTQNDLEVGARYSEKYSSRNFLVPFRRRNLEISHDEILAELEAHLLDNKNYMPVALVGQGGSGKTTSAIEYSYHFQKLFEHVVWVDASSAETFRSALINWGKMLGSKDFTAEESLSHVSRFTLSEGQQCLIILDDIADAEFYSNHQNFIGNSRIILTSRDEAWRRVGVIPLAIPLWTKAQSTEFFIKRISKSELNNNSLGELVTALHGLALAHTQAAAYIETTRISAAQYVNLLRNQGPSAAFGRPEACALDSQRRTILATVKLARNLAAARHPAADVILKYISLCAPSAVPIEIFTKGYRSIEEIWSNISISGSHAKQKRDPTRFDEIFSSCMDRGEFDIALRALLASALVERTGFLIPSDETDIVSLHPLVREIVLETIAIDSELQHEQDKRELSIAKMKMPLLAALQFCLRPVANIDRSQWPLAQNLAGHVLHITKSPILPITIPCSAQLIDRAAGVFQYISGDLRTSINLRRTALSMLEDVDLNQSAHERLTIRHNLAAALQQVRQRDTLAEAIHLMEMNLDAEEQSQAGTLADRLILRSNLALALIEMGEQSYLDRVQVLLDESKNFQAQSNEQIPLIAEHFSTLANYLQIKGSQKDLIEARELFHRALALLGNLGSRADYKRASVLSNLSLLFAKMEEETSIQEGFDCINEAINIDTELYGPESSILAVRYTNRAEILRAANNEDYYQLVINDLTFALKISENCRPDDVSQILSNRGSMYTQMLKRKEAFEDLLKAIAIEKKAFGRHHPRMATRLGNLAIAIVNFGIRRQFSRAEKMARKALLITRQNVTENHIEIAVRLNTLTSVLLAVGSVTALEEARKNLELEIKIRQANGLGDTEMCQQAEIILEKMQS